MTHDHYEMRFAGSGGQGMMLMGDIMAEAAGGLDDKEIVLTRSYGPEARGGACRSELIIDTRPIDYPTVRHPDFVPGSSRYILQGCFLPRYFLSRSRFCA